MSRGQFSAEPHNTFSAAGTERIEWIFSNVGMFFQIFHGYCKIIFFSFLSKLEFVLGNAPDVYHEQKLACMEKS